MLSCMRVAMVVVSFHSRKAGQMDYSSTSSLVKYGSERSGKGDSNPHWKISQETATV